MQCETHEEDTGIWRLLNEEKWNELAARLKTDEGKTEARQKILRSQKNLNLSSKPKRWQYLCHEPAFLENAPFSCIDALGQAYPEGWSQILRQGLRFSWRSRFEELEETVFGTKPYYVERTCPLHVAAAIAKPRDPSLVQHVYQMAPKMILERNEEGEMPLHIACKEGNSSAVQVLVTLCPEAARDKKNDSGLLPLHFLTCHLAASQTDRVSYLQCLRQLLRAYPKAAEIADQMWCTPLHTLLSWDICEDDTSDMEFHRQAVAMLIEAYPEGVKRKSKYGGELPIHMAARNFNCCSEIIDLLYQQFPESIHVRNEKGEVPVSIMLNELSSRSSTKALGLLLPNDADKMKEILFRWCGRAPFLYDEFHWRQLRRAWEVFVVEKITDPYPESLTAANNFGCIGLTVLCTDLYFQFPSLFRYMAKVHPEQLFIPSKWSILGRDDEQVTPLTRLWSRLAGPKLHTDDEKDVIAALQMVFRNLHRDSASSQHLLLLESKCDDNEYSESSNLQPPYIANESTEENTSPPVSLIHLLCFFSAAMSPKDFGIVLERLFLRKPCNSLRCAPTSDLLRNFGLLRQDHLGNLPLHYVCSSYESSHCEGVVLNVLNIEGFISGKLLEASVFTSCLQMFGGMVLKHLDQECLVKMAQTKNACGELPLHMVMKRRNKLCCIQTRFHHVGMDDSKYLFSLYPAAAIVPDPTHFNFYPFMLAAEGCCGSRGKSSCSGRIETTYLLLQRFVAEHGCNWSCDLSNSNKHLQEGHEDQHCVVTNERKRKRDA